MGVGAQKPASGAGREKEWPTSTSRFAATFVCTGNRARSPFAAAVLERTAEELEFSARSFGLFDVGPAPALPEAVWAANVLGIDLGTHTARPLPRGALVDDDLVVGFEPFHVAAAVADGGAARGTVFLLTELAALLERVPVDVAERRSPRELVGLLDSVRGDVPSSWAPIPDPRGRSERETLAIFEVILAHLSPIANRLVTSSGTCCSTFS